MITTVNREYSDAMHHYTQQVNNELIEYANKFYGEALTPAKEKELLALSFDDKVWLLQQYKEELSSGVPAGIIPDLSHLY